MLYEIITAVVLLLIFIIVIVVMHNKITSVENRNTQSIIVQNKNFDHLREKDNLIVQTEHNALNVLRSEDTKFKTGIELLRVADQAFSDKYAKFEKEQKTTNESIDKRIGVMSESINKRIGDVEKSHVTTSETINRRIGDVEKSHVTTSETINRRIGDVEKSHVTTNKRITLAEKIQDERYAITNNVLHSSAEHLIKILIFIFMNLMDVSNVVQDIQNNYVSKHVLSESVNSVSGNFSNNVSIGPSSAPTVKITDNGLCIKDVCLSAQDLKTLRSKNEL